MGDEVLQLAALVALGELAGLGTDDKIEVLRPGALKSCQGVSRNCEGTKQENSQVRVCGTLTRLGRARVCSASAFST